MVIRGCFRNANLSLRDPSFFASTLCVLQNFVFINETLSNTSAMAAELCLLARIVSLIACLRTDPSHADKAPDICGTALYKPHAAQQTDK